MLILFSGTFFVNKIYLHLYNPCKYFYNNSPILTLQRTILIPQSPSTLKYHPRDLGPIIYLVLKLCSRCNYKQNLKHQIWTITTKRQKWPWPLFRATNKPFEKTDCFSVRWIRRKRSTHSFIIRTITQT